MNEPAAARLSPAEYKTLHEALGVSTRLLAERTGVGSGRIWAYESTTRSIPVPDHAAAVILQMRAEFDEVAARMASMSTRSGVIERLVNSDEFEERYPSMAGWGPLSQGLVVAAAQQLAQTGIEYA